MGIIKVGKIQSTGEPVGERYVKTLWFEQIDSGTSGTLTPPSQGEILLDQWAAGIDALASTISSGVPTFISPATAGGVIITATLGTDGAWTLSGTPSAYPVAIVYAYQVRLKYFDYTKQMGGFELIPSAGGVFTDVAAFNKNLSSADTTVQKALDTLDNLTVSDFSTMSGDATATAGGLVSFADFYKKRSLAELTGDSDGVYTATNLLSGWISRQSINTANRSDVTDTAANIVAAIPNAVIGSWFLCTIYGEHSPNFKTTLTGGVGVNVFGDSVDIHGQTSFTFLAFLTNITVGTEGVRLLPISIATAWGWALPETYFWLGGTNGQAQRVVMSGEAVMTATGAVTVTTSHSGSTHLLHDGFAKITVGTEEPMTPSINDLWLDTN